MTCEALRGASASDDPSDRAALEGHAAACAACAAFLEDERWLQERIGTWVDQAPLPPDSLERRIAAALAVEARAAAPALGLRRTAAKRSPAPAIRSRWLATAAAAVVLVAAAMMMLRGVTTGGRAVLNVEEAASQYARAIAELERQASAVLEQAGDPALASRQAAILLTYRDRLSHLDAVIAQVEGFLEQSPGHSGGHMVLMAAYKEKAEVLREVLAFKSGEPS